MVFPERKEPETVGVRELRQNLSVYLRRIRDGEELTVTERGVPVARLAPLQPVRGELQRMIDEGIVKPPKNPAGLRNWTPLPAHGRPLSEILQEMRDEEYED